MNIQVMRLKPVLRELRMIRSELARMNELRELELQARGIPVKAPPPGDEPAGDEPEITYTDEEQDYYQELAEEMGKLAKKDTDQ